MKWLWTFSAIGLLATSCGDLQAGSSLVSPFDEAVSKGKSEQSEAEQYEIEQAEAGQNGAAADYETISEPLTQLEIGYDTPSIDNASLTRGPVEVVVSYTAREDITEKNRPLLEYEIFYEGRSRVKDAVLAVGSGDVLIGDFDKDGGMEVSIQAFTGGAHCCTTTTVYSWNGNDFDELNLDETLSGDFEDIDGDGSFEFVTVDSNFLAKFSSYADSVAPPMVFSLVEGNFVDSTRNYPDYIYSKIADLEQRNQQIMNNHGLLAAYVADKILVGEYESGWAYLLDHYSEDPAYGSRMNIYDQDGNVIDQYDSFPAALDSLLLEQGYL